MYGIILSQYDDENVLYPIDNFFSTECNYDIYDTKLMVLVKCSTYWKPEFKNTDISVEINTDHKNFNYYKKALNLDTKNQIFRFFVRFQHRIDIARRFPKRKNQRVD